MDQAGVGQEQEEASVSASPPKLNFPFLYHSLAASS